MSRKGITVPPRSKNDIYQIASNVRSVFGLTNPYVPIESIYEILPDVLEGFNFEVVPEAKLGVEHGRTYPNRCLIWMREDVYDNACNGSGRDRFTMAHELGHLFMHRNIQFSRNQSLEPPKIYMDSEWQADTFASAFLIDDKYLHQCLTIQEVVSTFGVSYSAAKCRFGN